MVKESTEELDRSAPETIITNAKKTALLLTGLVLGARPTSASCARKDGGHSFNSLQINPSQQ